MIAYTLRRLALIPLTLFGIVTLNFLIAQVTPGGPVEIMLAHLQGLNTSANLSGTSEANTTSTPGERPLYRGAQGLDPELVKRVQKQFGFDKPAPERYLMMLRNYLTFNL